MHKDTTPTHHLDLEKQAGALQEHASYGESWSGDELAREERSSLRRVAGLEAGAEREEGVDIEYRQVRLERVVLVGLWQEGTLKGAEDSLRELAALATTAGSEVLDGLIQKRSLPDPATYIGSGKARELAELVASLEADTVIVDTELAPSQRRALEDIVQVKVIDRTALILDIFARHAASREGKAQVELAQLEYLLPRLRGWGESMSRQAGGRVAQGAGIGSRGPGETQIELDRRRIRTRMAKLRRDIATFEPARRAQRSARRKNKVPSVAIVGYTNAGKSSLMNRLSGSDVLVENALFATLDPTVRLCRTPSGREFTLSDTVGFVRKLPTQLVEAFRSTLEEAEEADLLLHMVDASHEDPLGQIAAVHEVLGDMRAGIPEILVLSKADLAAPITIAALRSQLPGVHVISTLTGEGLEELAQAIDDALPHPQVELYGILDYKAGKLLAAIHERGELLAQPRHDATGTLVHAFVDESLAHAITTSGYFVPAPLGSINVEPQAHNTARA